MKVTMAGSVTAIVVRLTAVTHLMIATQKKKEQMNFGCFLNISMAFFGGVLFKFILPAQKFEAAVS